MDFTAEKQYSRL